MASLTEREIDPLLECLVILTELNHHPFSAEALSAGLPLKNNKLTPSLFIRAAERAGFSSEIFEKTLESIDSLVLPAVLLLKNHESCLLMKLNEQDKIAEVIFPEKKNETLHITFSELNDLYLGFIILIRPVFEFESRTETNTEAEKHEKEKENWFWGALWRYRFIYLQVVVGALLINLFGLVGPLFIMNVYDRVVPNFAVTTLWVLALGVFIIFTFDFILRLLRSYLVDVCGKKADTLMSSTLFQQVLGIQMISKPTSVGAFVSNLREFEVLRDFFTSATLSTLIDLPFVIFFIVVTWYIGGVVVLVPLVIVPLILLAAFLLEKPLRETVFQAILGSMQKHAILVESITGLETIKCLTAEGSIQKKWENYVGLTAKLGLKARFISGLVISIANFGQQIVTVGVIIVGVYLIHDGQLTLGGLIACSILAGRILAPLSAMANVLSRFQQAKVALDNLNTLMKVPVERPRSKRFLYLPKIKGDIEFENVTFQYPDQENLALNNVSFKIKARERVAIVGRIGSGKSTIQKMLLGLYSPKEGNIRIDGIDIHQIDPIDLRRNIGYVSQDSLLFFGTVRDNIAMSVPGATDAAIVEAARLAGVDTFVHIHPAGYSMPVGERGEGLSGGQRQSIAIARALIADPPIWLMDEPTSAMDNSSELELIQRLVAHLQDKTIILVTHRITLFPLVDRIMVMDGGRLLVDGPKDKVIAMLTQKPPANAAGPTAENSKG